MGSTKADIEKARLRRQKLITAVLDMLTDPQTAPTPEEVFHWQFIGREFGVTEHVDRATSWANDKPDLREELLCGLLYDVMNRLI